MSKYAVIIPAAGSSSRMKGLNKLNIDLGGKTVLERSVGAFDGFDSVVVVGKDVPGGSTRTESVWNGIKALPEDVDFVLIHDGARPFVTAAVIENVKAALMSGAKAVVPCVRPKNTIRTKDATLNRDELFEVQTPQGFDAGLLRECYERAMAEGFCGTDDASITEHFGIKTTLVEGDVCNIKITTPSDIPGEIRYGNGYDLHRLVEGRPLWLGLCEIPFEKGLLGHSDADVIVHAICDAILGAAALGDIGKHFPDTDPKWEGLPGRTLLAEVRKITEAAGFTVLGVDATLVAQKPKISPYTIMMRREIAGVLGLDESRVSIKATTEEGLGSTGKGEAMAAYATATIK